MQSFIEIKKSDLKRILKSKNIKNKYQDEICIGIRNIIFDSLEDTIEQSIEQLRIIEGQESLEKY